MPTTATMPPKPTTEERLERVERAIGQIGYHLQRTSGSGVWRSGRAADLLALTEELLGERFDPMAPTRGHPTMRKKTEMNPETDAEAETEDVDVVAEVREHRRLLDRLLGKTLPDTDRPVPAHTPIPSQYSEQLEAVQTAARKERVRQAAIAGAEQQAQWHAEAPKRQAEAKQRAEIDQRIARTRAELAKLEAEYAKVGRT